MRIWVTLLGGLIVWALHFFALYAVGSIFLTTDLARGLTILLTVACLAIVGLVGLRAWRGGHLDAASQWARVVALWSVLISIIAILWQGAVAVLI
jgi:hypothetical protein